MQAQAYDGYVENGQFFPKNTLARLPGRFRAVLTVVLEEPLTDEPQANPTAWFDEFCNMVQESSDEELNMENFPRMNFGREPIDFSVKE